MGQTRRALLIGIGQAPATADLLEPLDEVVEADLRLMGSVLNAAGYEVETLHDAGLSRIRTMIYEIGSDLPADSTFLLYFTGHGVRVGGTDYLVPSDAKPPRDGIWREPYVDSLLPANISSLLKDCAASTVLWLIDACRTDLSGDGVAFANTIDNGPPNGGFAVMAGCSAGQRSGHTPEGSFFTRGLAHALGPMTPARTVHDVFTTARARTTQTARRHGLTQTAVIRYGTNGEPETREKEVCEGRPLLEAWLLAARENPLWERIRPEDRGSVPLFQDCVAAFVEQCARTLHLAQERLPHPDPWYDETFPARLVRERLPLLLPPSEHLSAIEAVLLVAAPFLREAAWADRLSQAIEIAPYHRERLPGADAHRRHYEQISEQYARIARKAVQCRARGRDEDETTVTMWLVHRWIADRFTTDDEAVPTAPARALIASLGVAPDRVSEVSDLLCAATAGTDLDEPLDDLCARSPNKVFFPSGHQPLRVRPLAALLRLATALCVDVRTLPEVVAEHLAVTDPVLPQHLIGIAHGLSWAQEGTSLHLDAPCPHQAVHAALIEVVDEADQLAAQVLELEKDLRQPEASLLSAVPTRITDRDLRPARIGGQEPYEFPLLRFHLAQTEVRELLMGEQLYGGEPHLALRELYQNAMDACRYRAMRWAYLEGSGARPAGWTGQIAFSQGEDERGRYVECRDNGVGMSADLLKHTFTQAGSRFERSKAFRREQSRWLRHDPALRLYPNSRFGIGVLSYFMLAEEMTIVTRPVSPEGIPAEHALRVDIPSSGSLFRIQRHNGSDDGLAEGGTRVRLYLREGSATDGLSCARVLRDLVRVSEFDLTARDASGYAHHWVPGKLQPPSGDNTSESLEAVPGVLWWVVGPGAVLCDGIVTDQEPYGYVLNLTGAHAGKLSVSRKELQDFDHEWAEEQWRRGADALVTWPRLGLDWLGRLDLLSRPVAKVLDAVWRGKGITVEGWGGKRVSLDVIGWFHLDRHYLEQSGHGMTMQAVGPWRLAALEQTARHVDWASPLSLAGHPLPEPGDADLVTAEIKTWHGVVSHAARHRMTPSDVLHRLRRLRIAHPSLAPLPVTEGAPDWIPDPEDGALADALRGGARRDHPTARVAMGADGIDDLAGLVLASAQLAVPLGKLAERLARYSALHTLQVPPPPEHHRNHTCTEADVAVLFTDTSGRMPRELHRTYRPDHVQEVCEKTELSPSETLRHLGDFGWLGWTAPALEEVEPWLKLDDTLHEVVRLFAFTASDGRRTLGWAATVDYADTLRLTLGEAERRLVPVAARLNLVFERRYAEGRAGADHTPSPDAAALVREMFSSPLEQGIDLAHLHYASVEGDFDVTQAIEDLRTAGVTVPETAGFVTAWPELGLRTRYVLSGNDVSMEEENFPAQTLTPGVLVSAAAQLSESLEEVWELAEQHAAPLGLTVPPLPRALAQYRPPMYVHYALFGYPTSSWRRLTPSALARCAQRLAVDPATAYEQLSSLRVLGALVPELQAEEVEALRGAVPGERDLVALGGEHRLTGSDAPYTVLDLVSIAGRLGEPLPVTVSRITPYLPLCPALTSLPPVPDVVPLWQDLALLSRHFDGRLPALEGEVTKEHIRGAVEATKESEDWVRGRLRLYATACGLHLDESEEERHD